MKRNRPGIQSFYHFSYGHEHVQGNKLIKPPLFRLGGFLRVPVTASLARFISFSGNLSFPIHVVVFMLIYISKGIFSFCLQLLSYLGNQENTELDLSFIKA